ncbi:MULTISPECIES: lipopolysaccharide biosynthesis protein [unclassified Proteiniphilum]|jgi:O-antigen/teichoic acid export membrane protein|uniref:lipopolysaccharide biosynthesis protein n=1 Tax=unclassified Proteiniphilum TaxID=2622718 RepID=UPI00257B6030|nr:MULTISPECIES: lipopolysaccharide biosynthesis protein [unclassified Proteiniphilum]
MAESTLKQKTTVSLFWSFADKFGQQLINLGTSIVLMRILDPSEYGLIGALALFIAFSGLLIDSGFTRSLLNRKTISTAEYSTVFYFNISLALLLYVILFLAAPFLAKIFHEPRIEPVSRILFLSLIFNSGGIIQQTLLTKKADFRGITRINIAALLIAASVAIVMALNGYGVWSLVVQTVLLAFFRTIFLWFYSKWKPVMIFSSKLLRSFMGISNKLLLTSVINAVFNNIYPSIIAFFYPNSMKQVGYYSQASKYQDIPFGILSNSFRSVSMLILPEINNQTERLKRVLSKMIKSLAFLSFPAGFLMILIAEPAFAILFKEKWLPAVPYFRILCLAGVISPFAFVLNELFISREKANYFLGVEIVRRIILVLLIALLFSYGIIGLAASWVIYTYITLIISLVLSGRLVDYSLLEFLTDALPYALVAFVSCAVGYLITLNITGNYLFLVINIVLVSILYLLLCRLFKLEMAKEIEEWLSSKRKKHEKS